MSTSDSDSAELVVPTGWVIDWITRDRLERALATAPADVAGVAAWGGPLPPGSSYRTYAEWRALEARMDRLTPVDGPIRAAVLVRPGVAADSDAGEVTLEGRVMSVSGTHAHDPAAEVEDLSPASAEGRSPFPVRPIVVFLSCDGAPGAWVAPLVNGLVESDVEARIASARIPRGPHLTRPCSASVESMRALVPDTLVTLDDGAREVADDWCGSERSTTIVDVDPDTGSVVTLVDWHIGRASGRIRARIRPDADAPTVAALVSRLTAGPQPLPPSVVTP